MIFKGGYRITQLFGENPDYYKQFGIPWHEGLDLTPLDDKWEVYTLPLVGKVVRDEDNPRSGAYGKYVTVWYPEINMAYQYCHLETNYVSIGDDLTPMQMIGKMGNTGNSAGAHIHLNCIAVDKLGYRQKQHGITGRIDGLKQLIQYAGTPVNISGIPWYTFESEHPEWRGVTGG